MSLKSNAIANYFGQGWTALMSLAFLPIYIMLLGIEAWGLVGFLSLMQAWLVILDLGLAPTLAREMARFEAGALTPQAIRDLLRSLEWLYGGIGVSVVIVVALASPWLARHWLQSSSLAPSAVTGAVATMGLVLATRMAEQVYRSAIQGLQRQVWLNSALAVLATLRWAGVVPLLLVRPAIEVFFAWQAGVSVLTVAVLAWKTYRCLPAPPQPAKFDLDALRRIRRFAGGLAATTFLGVLLTQVDKLLLSRLVSLDEFGCYTLASAATAVIAYLTGPIVAAVAPHFAKGVASESDPALAESYHRACQWVAVMAIPFGCLMVGYAEPLLRVWIGKPDIAARTAPLLSLMAAGSMLNSVMHIPNVLQIAHGWNGLTLRTNCLGVAIMVPAILWTVPHYGAIAAPWTWLVFNVVFVAVAPHIMHRRLLTREKWRWYRDAVLAPLAAGGVATLLSRQIVVMSDRPAVQLLTLTVISAIIAIATSLAVPVARDAIWARLYGRISASSHVQQLRIWFAAR